jgi:hypothetical protein
LFGSAPGVRMNTQDRLKEASDRTIEIYTHVGYLSTHFAGLELTLLKLTAKITNPGEPEHEEKILSQLSFSQTVEKFIENVKKLLPNSEAVTEAESLAIRLRKAASDRNDIIHSSWIAYAKGDYGQHRARTKKENKLATQLHKNNPVNHIDEVTDSIYGLIFDLACFEARIRNKTPNDDDR